MKAFFGILLFAVLHASGASELASKTELYTGKEYSSAFANPEDNPNRPNVLLIGDSISIGYTVEVRKLLKGKADVFRIPGNGKYAAYGLENLDEWLGTRKWDVIHFNWGLWDLCYRNPESKMQGHRDKVKGTLTATPEQYRATMEKIVSCLKKTDATLIWCTTTPVPEFEAGRKVGDDLIYNRVAKEIMVSNGVLINDLHAHALLRQTEIQKQQGDVHYTEQGYAYLAEKVAQEITSAIAAKPSGVSGSRPNFVIIFTDDQGYGDLSCYGASHVDTPRIDQMAAEGARLTSFYVAAPVCTPSRAALMTGCYPKRIDMAMGSNFGVLLAGDSKGLHPDEITIAEVLKTAGYKTGMFGKWHLGDQPEFLPTKQGFEEYWGIPYSHDIHPFHPRQDHYGFPPLPLLEGDTVIEMEPDADFLTRRITEGAVNFIKKHRDAPFFLYVPHPIPHAPLHVSPRFMEGVSSETIAKLQKEDGNIDYTARHELFRQAIAEIDWSVGEILDALKANGLDENTLVLFTSDNGPPKNTLFASPGPLRGNKGTTWEGGMREPTVIRWPGRIPSGTENDKLMTTMDLLPTFSKLAGAKVPTDRVIDGKDIWPTLTHGAETPHEAFFYHGGNVLKAVRSGKWKLHLDTKKEDNTGPSSLALYDLESDVGEKTDVLAKHPAVEKRLLSLVKAFEKELSENSRPAAFVEDPKPLSIEVPE